MGRETHKWKPRKNIIRGIGLILVCIALLLMVGEITGCAGIQVVAQSPLTASKTAYVEALDVYRTAGLTFIMWFEAADEVTQEKWRQEIKPLFRDAKKVLDSWKALNDIGEVPADATDWQTAKTKMLIAVSKIAEGI